ncbi:hypothetical protein GCM10010346_38080 [Streptomyces chryseus]|uniref:Uncharacterized protein n=1 Tax=Streptomyces chryseus TaxID=68186 RepID=A0ABQ3DR45_9ACTN|nr:hypothetical protein GCM10010346_38080 [Streptomyces chryseus]
MTAGAPSVRSVVRDSTQLYRDITGFARTTPSWVRHLAELWTEAVIRPLPIVRSLWPEPRPAGRGNVSGSVVP